MKKVIRIGTRDSDLALWQAHTVQHQLEALGYETEIIAVKSTGDLVLDKPLYELGITGIFTKTLDVAMLNGTVDIAVHSMKDVPTALPQGIIQSAVLKRANTNDVLLHKGTDFLNGEGVIATGSLRRKAQWLYKYPTHKVIDLRGNVNTRLQKLEDNAWNGAIFAQAGLERLKLLPNHMVLDWMVPAPAQGAMVVVSLASDSFCTTAVAQLNHEETDLCTKIERDFLRTLEGGCTAPIGAIAKIENNTVFFTGTLHALDGSNALRIIKEIPVYEALNFGVRCGEELLAQGGSSLMASIKEQLPKKG